MDEWMQVHRTFTLLHTNTHIIDNRTPIAQATSRSRRVQEAEEMLPSCSRSSRAREAARSLVLRRACGSRRRADGPEAARLRVSLCDPNKKKSIEIGNRGPGGLLAAVGCPMGTKLSAYARHDSDAL